MKFVAIVLLSLNFGMISAQNYTFKVLVSKGQNAIKAGNEWQPVKVGSSLNSVDELRIAQNGYLGLVHVSGKPLEVKDAGQHKVGDLAAKIREGSSVLNKYTDFILSSNEQKKNNLTATGAVYRGDYVINTVLPKSQHAIVLNDEIIVSWTKEPGSKAYVVRFNSMFGDELDRMEVRDTSVAVNLGGSKLANEDNILLEISSKTDAKKTSEPVMLKKLSLADRKRINAELAKIAEQTKEETALNQLILAGFYESHQLFIDAATAHQKAIRLAPEVPEFRSAYRDFIARNALDK